MPNSLYRESWLSKEVRSLAVPDRIRLKSTTNQVPDYAIRE
ncbi:MAG: hypothetical protein RIE73_06385 [Coleofasciculus sp. C1-SOL-03]